MRRGIVILVVLALMGQALAAARPGRGDPLRVHQWGLDAIKADQAWEHSRGEGTVIAVLDTGVDLQHPDLRANIVRGYDFVRGRPGADDRDGHGTMVAGIAAAVGDNGIGITGIAPEATILPVRVCSDLCDDTLVAKAIRYAARRGADAINMSFWVPLSDENLPDVLEAVAFAERKGAVVVAAAGNDREPVCREPASSALCVGALDRSDQRASYTNFDVLMSDNYIMAPGGDGACQDLIVSTSINETACPGLPEGYTAQWGTSLAAPFVAGVAALMAGEGATVDEIRSCLLETTDDLGPEGRDAVYGYGKLNAAKALACAHRSARRPAESR